MFCSGSETFLVSGAHVRTDVGGEVPVACTASQLMFNHKTNVLHWIEKARLRCFITFALALLPMIKELMKISSTSRSCHVMEALSRCQAVSIPAPALLAGTWHASSYILRLLRFLISIASIYLNKAILCQES